ncbi:hypothetical protein DFP72DRAFT_134571 [Ephemerocybe angulata]|uniref:Uncharacterized protein n=1 Tax=Ephemerocybe angulata TaxID=980116 RepID=A0A8H6I7N7_9AGAR|nr:hypothetical protein DFP72DRAFT_134571 [Tulosesus angulatus]
MGHILPGARNVNVNELGYNDVAGNLYSSTINIYTQSTPSTPPRSLFLEIWGRLGLPGLRTGNHAGGSESSTVASTDSQSESDLLEPSEVTTSPVEELNPPSVTRLTTPQVYVYSMLNSGHGLACWKPQPWKTAPPKTFGYRREEWGAKPGDVGIYRVEDGFKRLFNVWDDEDAIQNTAKASFSPVPYLTRGKIARRITTRREFEQGDTVTHGATSVVHEGPGPNGRVERFEFTCPSHAEQGAILALTSPGTLNEVQNQEKLRDHICNYAELFYNHANKLQQLGSDESLYIVTASIKSRDWGIAAFRDHMFAPDNVLILAQRNCWDQGYRWTHRGSAEARYGVSESRLVDECLFLRGFKLDFSAPFRTRMKSQSLSLGLEEDEAHDQDAGYRTRGENGEAEDSKTGDSDRLNRDSNSAGRSGSPCTNAPVESSMPATHPGEVRVNRFHDSPGYGDTLHPCDVITKYLLTQTGADFVLSHDDDWRHLNAFQKSNRVPTGDSSAISSHSLTSRRMELLKGVAFLGAPGTSPTTCATDKRLENLQSKILHPSPFLNITGSNPGRLTRLGGEGWLGGASTSLPIGEHASGLVEAALLRTEDDGRELLNSSRTAW